MSNNSTQSNIKTIIRPAIINAARQWIGTPFHHQGRKRGVGCDCLGLIVGVANELGLLTKNSRPFSKYDQHNYHFQFDSHLLAKNLRLHLISNQKLVAGNIALFTFKKHHNHLGIIGLKNNEITIIHACMIAKKVIEQPLRQRLLLAISEIFSFI
jgi:cell wall-associated NlpC family hydrolase